MIYDVSRGGFTMDIWHAFVTAMRRDQRTVTLLERDREFAALVGKGRPPLSRTDDLGVPLPGCAVVTKHPDPANLRRIVEVRKQLATDHGDPDYETYAEGLLTFLDSLPDSCDLWVGAIRTQKQSYELFLERKTMKFICSPVSK